MDEEFELIAEVPDSGKRGLSTGPAASAELSMATSRTTESARRSWCATVLASSNDNSAPACSRARTRNASISESVRSVCDGRRAVGSATFQACPNRASRRRWVEGCHAALAVDSPEDPGLAWATWPRPEMVEGVVQPVPRSVPDPPHRMCDRRSLSDHRPGSR